MKVAVINFSGNVGKSMISRHLLLPRIPNAQLIPIETINSDDSQEEALKGKDFGQLSEALAIIDDAVIDIGASNVEELINQMKAYRGSHEDFDFYIVPVVPNQKQQRDTISTIEALNEIGVPAKKIRVVFNMVGIDDKVETLFAGLSEYHESEKTFTLRPGAVIRMNDIYGKLNGSERTIADILNDPTDLKEQLKTAANDTEKLRISRQIGLKRLAAGVTEELDAVFKAVLK